MHMCMHACLLRKCIWTMRCLATKLLLLTTYCPVNCDHREKNCKGCTNKVSGFKMCAYVLISCSSVWRKLLLYLFVSSSHRPPGPTHATRNIDLRFRAINDQRPHCGACDACLSLEGVNHSPRAKNKKNGWRERACDDPAFDYRSITSASHSSSCPAPESIDYQSCRTRALLAAPPSPCPACGPPWRRRSAPRDTCPARGSPALSRQREWSCRNS
mmetsp:Transcript_7845/g.15376  ORF Transcript_7845/g.15376 Transcript_7845/m.15376 type:complete len:215 (-) Transcript_7845:703-1347(-)